MKRELSDEQARLLRIRAQLLTANLDDSVAGAAQVLKAVCGVQAQETAAAALAVRPRGRGLTAATIEHVRVRERTIVRTWCMRGTLHMLTAEDLAWLLPLLGPVFIEQSRRRYAELGLEEKTLAEGIDALNSVLASRGPLTRSELVQHLADRGIRLVGQAAYHLLRRAALEAVVCFGPSKGREPTYVLLESWIEKGRTLSIEESLAELARRYLSAYAPAGVEDLSTWSGLPLKMARAAWRSIVDEIVEVELAGQTASVLKSQSSRIADPRNDRPSVRLLPSFDTYLLGYHNRHLTVAPQYAKLVHPGGGLLRPTLLVDGRAAGTWKVRRHRDHTAVVIKPFEQLPLSVESGAESEVADIGRFLECKTALVLERPSRLHN